MGDYNDLIVYQKAYKLAMDIFEITKRFPPEEKFSLTDQIRRSSRSVCVNFVEAYRRRRYKAIFSQNLMMRKLRMQKPRYGLIFQKTVNTSHWKNTMIIHLETMK